MLRAPLTYVLPAVVLSAVSLAALAACGRALEPSNKPIDNCIAACEKKAARQCSSDECARGCEFILDRLVEREGDTVLACVGRSARRCSDVVWADCAVRVGVHADGGPPAPPPPPDDFE